MKYALMSDVVDGGRGGYAASSGGTIRISGQRYLKYIIILFIGFFYPL